MKYLVLILSLSLVHLNAFANDFDTSTTDSYEVQNKKQTYGPMSIEGGFTYSSIDEGDTYYLTAGIIGNLGRWVTLGARGNIPVYHSINNNDKFFSIEALARFNFLNNENNLFIEGTMGFGKNNYRNRIGVWGTSIGYNRVFKNGFAGGLRIGANFIGDTSIQNTPFTALTIKKLF